MRNPLPTPPVSPPQAAKAARQAGRHPLGPGRSEGVRGQPGSVGHRDDRGPDFAGQNSPVIELIERILARGRREG